MKCHIHPHLFSLLESKKAKNKESRYAKVRTLHHVHKLSESFALCCPHEYDHQLPTGIDALFTVHKLKRSVETWQE